MANSLTKQQQAYLDNIRDGDTVSSGFAVQNSLTQGDLNEFDNFEQFIKDSGRPNPQAADLYLTVSRDSVLESFKYAQERNCLILQACFGLDSSITTGGRVQLIHKGNMFKSQAGVSDETIFKTVFKVVRNGRQFLELFLNMSPDNLVPVGIARQYIKNLRANYSGRTDPFTLGYLFPVRALITLFTDQSSPLGRTNTFAFRWGLSDYNYNNGDPILGNLSVIISTDDLMNGPVIVFRSPWANALINPGDPTVVPCPPNTGCQI